MGGVTVSLPERASDNTLPAFAWPGGCPLVYLDSDNADLCPACANRWGEYSTELTDAYIHWEGAPITCENCGNEIESAYGNPDKGAAS
jgi:hypothetical protein